MRADLLIEKHESEGLFSASVKEDFVWGAVGDDGVSKICSRSQFVGKSFTASI